MILSPPYGNIAAVIGRHAVLFIGTVMFFIHHDEAKIGKRQKDGTARTDNNSCPAGSDFQILLVFLLGIETAVIDGCGIAKA